MAPERGEGLGEENVAASPALDLAILPLGGSHDSMLNIKEEEIDGIGRSEDDDLTSLSWLQDKNLLKGINLRRQGGKQESPPSDYIEESPSESTCSSVASSPAPMQSPATPNHSLHANKHPHHIPYDPKIHITSKPPYSFSCLIFMSIENSAGKALPVKEIYAWILEHFPYYRTAPTGWKNSVRHNLSLNKCFRKVDKAPNLGKGSLWMVDPVFRPNLVQALMKAPYHPYTNLDKITAKDVHIRASPIRERRDSDTNGYTSVDEIDDVDAARAMLALKHGPNHINFINNNDNCHKDYASNEIKHKVIYDEIGVVMMRRSDEDHTYSVDTAGTDSADEAFNSDSNSSWCMPKYSETDLEEQRKTAEGADALLHLARIPIDKQQLWSSKVPTEGARTWISSDSQRQLWEKKSPETPTNQSWGRRSPEAPSSQPWGRRSPEPLRRRRSPEPAHEASWRRSPDRGWLRKRSPDPLTPAKHRRLSTLNNNTIKVKRKAQSPMFKAKR